MASLPFRRRKRDTGEITKTITTMRGVERVDQPHGQLTISRGDGDTVVEVLADDGEGNEVALFLDVDAVAQAMFAFGAVAVDL